MTGVRMIPSVRQPCYACPMNPRRYPIQIGSLRIRAEPHAVLVAYAKRTDQSISDVLRAAIDAYANKIKPGSVPPETRPAPSPRTLARWAAAERQVAEWSSRQAPDAA